MEQVLQETIGILESSLNTEQYTIDYLNIFLDGFWLLFVPLVFICIFVVYWLIQIARNSKYIIDCKIIKRVLWCAISGWALVIISSLMLSKYEYLYTDGKTQQYLITNIQPRHLDIPSVSKLYNSDLFSRKDVVILLNGLKKLQRQSQEMSDKLQSPKS